MISLDADFWYFKGREFKIFYPFYVFKELRYVHKVIFMNFKNSMKKYSSFCNFRKFFIKVQKIMLEFCDKKLFSEHLENLFAYRKCQFSNINTFAFFGYAGIPLISRFRSFLGTYLYHKKYCPGVFMVRIRTTNLCDECLFTLFI